MTISGSAGGGVLLESSGGLLAEFAASKAREAVEQVWQVELALEFCAFNSPDSIGSTGSSDSTNSTGSVGSRGSVATLPGTEGELALAGVGAPGVAEFAVVEFGAVAKMSTEAARVYLGRCLELGHRLPRVWAAARAGQVPAWRALRIAAHTPDLPLAGAAWVDEQVAPVAGRVGPGVLTRVVQEAVVRFDPETAAQAAIEALESRHATLTLDHTPATGLGDLGMAGVATGRLEAVLELGDALDLDAALADLAADLATAGDTTPLDVRRARALGLLARGESVPEVETRRREVVLHVHLAEAALHRAGDGIATVSSHTGHPLGLVTVEQVQDWCATPGAHVSVRPVLDLAETIRSTGYAPSARLREQVTALNPTCVFPYCHRPATGLDLDHITPHAQGGATDSTNLAPLCRRHHRAKTHGGWRYHRLGPAEHLWTSPHQHQWVTDTDGTRPTTPPGLSTGPP
jgi:5-methylcytosine-specific restriction endonuclease McrA